jgi:predicted Zn finger-like uncharacterized protein
MLITCPNCQSSYTVADTALGEKGRSVRCTKCKEVWHATPPPPAMAEPAAEEWQPSVDEWKPSTDEWQPPTDEWKPSVDEWQPTADPPAAEAGSAEPTGDAAWPQSDAAPDVDPPHVDDAPPVAPMLSDETAADAGSAALAYESVRRRKAARKQAQKERGIGITAGRVAAALALVLVALLFARETVVRIYPQTASLYGWLGFRINVRGLEFADLKSSYDTQDGTRVLFVEGGIRNISSKAQSVANLRYALRNAAGVEVYSWTGVPDRNMIPPGETTQFRTRLASPPNDGRDVRVTFVQREADAPQKH